MEFSEIKKDLQNLRVKGWYRVWEPFMKKYNCQKVCELGVYKGDHFARLIAHRPELAVAVDLWRDDGVPSHNDSHYSQEELDGQYEHVRNQFGSQPNVKIIRDYTTNAANLFPDNSFDFVYIDADHSYEGSFADILNWYPKVKPGKFLVGHDYRRGFRVVESVNKFIKEQNLELIFLKPSTWAVIKQ